MTNSPQPSRSRDNQAEIQSIHERDHGSARDNTSHRVLDHHTLTLYIVFDFVDGNTSGQCSAQERAPCFELLLCGHRAHYYENRTNWLLGHDGSTIIITVALCTYSTRVH